MTQTTPAIKSFQISGLINPSISNPLFDAIQMKVPFNFQAITVLDVITGQYTPNNDTHLAYTFDEDLGVNFLLILVDQPSVIDLAHSSQENAPISGLPITKMTVLPIPDLTVGHFTTLEFNGGTAEIAPMQQNVLMNYTVVVCAGQVT